MSQVHPYVLLMSAAVIPYTSLLNQDVIKFHNTYINPKIIHQFQVRLAFACLLSLSLLDQWSSLGSLMLFNYQQQIIVHV